MAKVLAILQGLESKASLSLDDSIVEKYYTEAQRLQVNGYVAIKVNNGYRIQYHPVKWTRRIR